MVGDHPVKWCTVSTDEVIARGKRLDASAYNVEARNAKAAIEDGKYPLTTICGNGGFATAYVGGRFKRIWVEKSDYPIYQPSEIVNVSPSPDGWLSARTQADLDSLRVHKGQILLTCSGTIGKAALVSATLDGKIFSHDLLRVDCKRKEDVGYVYAYLKSRVGNKILLTNSYGAVITHIEPEHLNSIPIPDAPEEVKRTINGLVVRSYELRDESNALIDKATALMVEALKLPPIEKMVGTAPRAVRGGRGATALPAARADTRPHVNMFSVSSDALVGRLDASYHVPIVKAVAGHLKQHAAEVASVADPRISKEIILPGRFKRVYVEEGYGTPFFSGRSIGELDPSEKKYLSFARHEKRIKAQLTIHADMILVTCSGSIGEVAFVPRHWDGWTMTHDIIRIVPNEELSGFVYVWLQAQWAKLLITAKAYGAVVQHIDKDHISSIPVPLLKDNAVQDEINALALVANEKRFEAYNLEQQALSVMEHEVLCPTMQDEGYGIE